MRNKLPRGLLLQAINIIVTQGTVAGFEPLAIAEFTALFCLREMRIVTYLVSLISLFITRTYGEAVKYAIIISTIAAVVIIAEKLSGRILNIIIYGMTDAMLTTIFEITDMAMSGKKMFADFGNPLNYLPIILGVGVFLLTVAFYQFNSHLYIGNRHLVFRNEEMICTGIMIASIVYAIGNNGLWDNSWWSIKDYGVQSAAVFSFYIIAFVAYKYGSGMGGIAGAACGMIYTFVYGNTGMLGALCMIGIVAGVFRELGRFGTAAGEVCCSTILGIFYVPELIGKGQAWSLAAAIILYVATPSSILYRYQKIEGTNDAFRRCAQLKKDEKLKSIAKSFEHLSKTFWRTPVKKDDLSFTEVSMLVDEVAKMVCTECTRNEQCWKRGKYEAYKETSELFKIAGEHGIVTKRDVNRQFFNKCKNVNGLILEVNHLVERSRVNLLWHNRLIDSKYAVATQLKEVSGIINEFSKETFNLVVIPLDKENAIKRRLHGKKLLLRRITMIENRHGKLELSLVIRSLKGVCVSTRDIEMIIKEVLGIGVRPQGNSKIIIGPEFSTLGFVEDVNFKVSSGAAKVAKGKEDISGDNFGFTVLGCGQMLMTISDGMGYGKYAYTESETVIELLEDMLESGFGDDTALKMINLVMMLNSDATDTATADMTIMDLYTGMCQFIKAGAAPTFIKRGNWVEVIKSTSVPLGVLDDVDLEKTSKKIYDGDMIIMVSDGVIDGLKGSDKEMELSNIIRDIDTINPKEFANELIRRVTSEKLNDVRDDMTVQVCAVWNN